MMLRHAKTPRTGRAAFTLIELLVVVALVVVIAAIGLFTVPLFQSQQRASSNASQIVSWLGNAKVQALKDQRSSGVRLVADPNNPAFVREIYYVQTPDDFTGGMGDPTGGRLYQNGPLGGPGISSGNTVAQPLTFLNVDFTGGLLDSSDWPVQSGDFLEINGGGLLYEVTGVINPTTLMVSRLCYVGAMSLDTNIVNPKLGLTGYYTTIWRIIRQPRRVSGLDSLTLNGSAAIDTTQTCWLTVPQRVVQVSPPTNPPTTQTYYEILFAPNGGVVGRGTNTSNHIVLWVRDSTLSDPTANEPVLISIQVRTGFIGTYSVDVTSGDYYSFTRDPRASGM